MPNRLTKKLHDLSCHAYGLVLALYPPGLTVEFGDAMAQAFAEQLREECAESGLAGFIRVWGRVAFEVIGGALPAEVDWFRYGVTTFSVTAWLVVLTLFADWIGVNHHCLK